MRQYSGNDQQPPERTTQLERDGVPKLFSAFDRIDIINLPDRSDRRREMKRQLRKVNLANDPRVSFFPATRTADPGLFHRAGAHGNFLSFRGVLNAAAASGQSLLILEDDCDFVVPDIFDCRLPPDCDIFYGGYEASDPDDLHGSDIIGAHFMGFSARAASAAANYLNRYLEPDFPLDAVAAALPNFNPLIRPPVDGAFVWFRRAHPELVTVFHKVSYQRPSRTDIGETRFYDRIAGVRQLVGMLRRGRDVVIGRNREMKLKKFD